jgi:hypothetical protein
MTTQTAAEPPRDPAEALIAENTRLSQRLHRERLIRREAEQIAEQGLRDLYQRQQRLETISLLAQRFSAALTPQDIGAVLAQQLLSGAGATALGLGLVDSRRDDMEWVTLSGLSPATADDFARRLPMNEPTVSADAIRSGQPIVIRTSAEYAQTYPAESGVTHLNGPESTVGWPLTAGGTPIGVLLLGWSEPQPLDTAQRAFISAVATMVSQALVRARLYVDEHARAAVLQSAVLPNQVEQIPGIDICVTYEPADPAHGVGGDWYDVMPLPGNRTYLAVGDVIGHGLAAVEDMAQIRGAGRALAHRGLPPAKLLTELNRFTRDVSNGKFATMVVAIFDRDEGVLSYCTAGHPPPILRRSDTAEVERLSDGHGPVLGPVRDAAYAERVTRVRPGDVLVMYTDGLVERRDRDIETGIAEVERITSDWDPGAEGGAGQQCGLFLKLLSTRNREDDVCVAAFRFNDDPQVGRA